MNKQQFITPEPKMKKNSNNEIQNPQPSRIHNPIDLAGVELLLRVVVQKSMFLSVSEVAQPH